MRIGRRRRISRLAARTALPPGSIPVVLGDFGADARGWAVVAGEMAAPDEVDLANELFTAWETADLENYEVNGWHGASLSQFVSELAEPLTEEEMARMWLLSKIHVHKALQRCTSNL